MGLAQILPHSEETPCKSTSAHGDELVVRFNEGETLTVRHPAGASISADEFRIEQAESVRWEWFYYGRAQRPENLYVMEYVRKGHGVDVADTADWYEPEHSPDPMAPAVVMG